VPTSIAPQAAELFEEQKSMPSSELVARMALELRNDRSV